MWNTTMRFSAACALIVFTALFVSGTAAAQSAMTRADKRVLRQQDEQECRRQAAVHSITKRNQAEFLRKCMGDRQGERRAAEKREAAEQSRIKRGMAAEEWTEIQKVRNQERRQQLEQQAARRAECSKEANEQKLRLRERRAFLKKCSGM
jgi:hypothetical protein